MIRNYKYRSIFFGIALLSVIFVSGEIEARGGSGGGQGGGGKSFSRRGSDCRQDAPSNRQSRTRKMNQKTSNDNQGQRNKMSDTKQSTKDNKKKSMVGF